MNPDRVLKQETRRARAREFRRQLFRSRRALVDQLTQADAEVVELQVPAGDGLPVVRCLPVAPLGDSNTVALGEPVLTIGNANGSTASTGELTRYRSSRLRCLCKNVK